MRIKPGRRAPSLLLSLPITATRHNMGKILNFTLGDPLAVSLLVAASAGLTADLELTPNRSSSHGSLTESPADACLKSTTCR